MADCPSRSTRGSVYPRSLPQSARGSGRRGGVTQSQSKQPSMVTCSALWGDLSTDVWSLPPGDASCYFYSAKPIGVENANDAGEVACNKPEAQAKGIERHMFLNSIRLRFRLASPVPAHSDGKSGAPIQRCSTTCPPRSRFDRAYSASLYHSSLEFSWRMEIELIPQAGSSRGSPGVDSHPQLR